MTEISFHFNAQDKYLHACRVIRKALKSDYAVAVVGEAHALDKLDATLWTFSSLDFIPHCRADAGAEVLDVTPVVLGTPKLLEAMQKPGQFLLNVGVAVPEGFERFERLIELVGLADDDRQLGRTRWKYYAARGYALTQHNLTDKAE
jgi:DNA polymerase-3 subunit chi